MIRFTTPIRQEHLCYSGGKEKAVDFSMTLSPGRNPNSLVWGVSLTTLLPGTVFAEDAHVLLSIYGELPRMDCRKSVLESRFSEMKYFQVLFIATAVGSGLGN